MGFTLNYMNPRSGNFIVLLLAGLGCLACSVIPGVGFLNYEQADQAGAVQMVDYFPGEAFLYASDLNIYPSSTLSDQPLGYSLTFGTHWWNSRWAFLFYVWSIIGLLYMVFRFQLKRMLAAQESRHQQEVRQYRYLLDERYPLELHSSLSLMSGPLKGVWGHAEEEDDKPIIKENAFLDKVIRLVEENLGDENFGISQLCQKLSISRSQLHRKLKVLTGKSTSMVIRSIRLEKARDLLRSSDLNVSEVGYAVGFVNRSHFTQVFTEEFGEAPSFFRGER